MTLDELRVKCNANLIGLLEHYKSGELLRWLKGIGQDEAICMISQIDPSQCVHTVLQSLKEALQLPVSDEEIDLTCQEQSSPFKRVRTLDELRKYPCDNLSGLYECWKSGELVRWLAGIGRKDIADKISELPLQINVRNVMCRLRKLLKLTIPESQIDVFCGAMVPPLKLAGNSSVEEKHVRTIHELRNISCDDLSGLCDCWKSGELVRWLADIGRRDIAVKITKLPSETNIQLGVRRLRKLLKLTIQKSQIDVFCGAMVPPLKLAGNSSGEEKIVRTIGELRNIPCDNLRGLYDCWKSGELARWLADIGLSDMVGVVSKLPAEANIHHVVRRLWAIFKMAITESQINEFCRAMRPPLKIAGNSSGEQKLVRTIDELRAISCDDLSGLYGCWKSGELARWLTDINQCQIAGAVSKLKKRWGYRRRLLWLRNALRLPFLNSDIDDFLQRSGECEASSQSAGNKNRKPNEIRQSISNNGDLQPKSASDGQSYPTIPARADIWAERARQEQERRVRQGQMRHEESESLSFQEHVQHAENEWLSRVVETGDVKGLLCYAVAGAIGRKLKGN